MALALYRRYRPRTFAEVIGQEQVTEPLMQALRTGRLNHAYLFSGPRGCGKTSSARILARSLNCEKGPTPEPCGVCDSCVALAPDGPGSLDVIEIDAASHGGVDDARDLRERAFFAPVSSRFKVYIIDEAHMISSQGFNALLKLVEEPPEFIKFVFATTEPEKVLGTIRSRTHHYPFRLIPPGVLRPYLEMLCQREGVAVEPTVFPLVVRAGGGSARDSLSVLDQLIAGAGASGVRYADAVGLLGVTDVALIDEVCDAFAASDGAAVFATIDRVVEAGHDPRRFAGDLLERLRDLIIFQQVPDAAGKGLLDAPADELGRMEAQARQFGPATLSRMADIVHTGLTEMRGTTAPRLLLELISARMLLPGAEDSAGSLLQRVERMERRLTATGDPLPPTLPPHEASAAGPPARSAAPAVRGAAQASPVVAAAPSQPEVSDPGIATSAGGRGARSRPAEAPGDPGPDTAAGPRTDSGRGDVSRLSTAPGSADVPGPIGPGDPSVAAGQAGAGGEPPVAVAAPNSSTPSSSVPGVVDAAAVRRVWEEILGYVRRRSQRAAAVVREAVVRDVEGNTVVLTFRHQFHAESLTASPELLEEAIYEVLGGRWRVRAEWPGGAAAGGTPGVSGSADRPQTPPPAVSPRRDASAHTETGPAPAGRSPASRPAAAEPADEEDWPVTARPGGIDPTPASDPSAPGQPGSGYPGSGHAGSGQAGQPAAGTSPSGQTGTGRAGSSRSGSSRGGSGQAGSGQSESGQAGPGQAGAGRRTSIQPGSGEARPGSERSIPAQSAAGGTSVQTGTRSAGGTATQAGSRAGAGRGAPARKGAAGGARRGTATDGAWQDAPPADEPPFDPDYDRPVRDPHDARERGGYEGFDPGDGPVDEEDSGTPRESSEEQALRLLRETLGAEKIGD